MPLFIDLDVNIQKILCTHIKILNVKIMLILGTLYCIIPFKAVSCIRN
jgi:hypothetical protein